MRRTALFCFGAVLSVGFLVAHQFPARAANPQARPFAPVQAGFQSTAPESPVYAPDRVLVKFSEAALTASQIPPGLAYNQHVPGAATGIASVDQVIRGASASAVRKAFIDPANRGLARELGVGRWFIVDFASNITPEALARRLAALPDVEAATPDWVAFPAVVPADPLYSMHWGHNNTSQLLSYNWTNGNHETGSPVGTVGFDCNAPAAWDNPQGYGSSSVIIAIIDTGVEVGHPDLVQVTGYDFGDNDSNPDDNSAQAGHGTACAGIAASASNSLGSVGAAPGCRIMPLKVANSAGTMYFSAIQNALYYAADHGANVISMSLGAEISSDPPTDSAIQYAYNAGCTILAATGNDNAPTISYPAINTYVVGVGAASPCGERKRSSSNTFELNPGVYPDPNGYTCDGERWWGSNYGVNTQNAAGAVDVIAPTILPTTDLLGAAGYDPSDYSKWFNGTSCATPYAAGVCALIKSANPTWTPAEVGNRLKTTAQDVTSVESGSGWDRYTGFGMVDAAAATFSPLILLSPVGGEVWSPGSQQTVQWTGGGPVKIELFADVTATGACLTGPVVVLNTSAPGNSATVTVPDVATRRARIQISRGDQCSYSPNPFTVVTPPAPGTWSYAAVDGPNHGWNQSDMCRNGNGVSAVYFDYLGGEDLRYASRIDKTHPWVPTIAKSAGRVGSWPSIVRGSDGITHVAYYDHTVYGARLYYTSGSGDPIAWSDQVLVDGGVYVVQGDCSIALDQNNVPYIAYNTGNGGGWKLRIAKQNPDHTWSTFGTFINDDIYWPHHITLKYAGNGRFWVAFTDQETATRLNIWTYNGVYWVKLNATFPAGPYTDVSLALDPYGYPQLAYTASNGTVGGQKLIFHPWSQEGSGLGDPVTIDESPGTISSVSLQYGWLYPRIGYVGNGVVKQATGVYSETEWPCAWTRQIVDATGNMDSQVSLVVNPGNDERWYLYRDLATQSMRSAGPYWPDSPPPAVTDLGFAAGYHSGVVWWTAPDDGNGGQAVEYDLRSNISPITEANFYNSTPWPVGVPQAPGTPECYTMTLSPCRFYYWAVKTRDWAGNWSLVSNSPGARTRCNFGPELICENGAPSGPPQDRAELPKVLSIGEIRPNPAHSPVVVPLAIPAAMSGADVALTIFDVTGRQVRMIDAGKLEPGIREVGWDLHDSSGRTAASGVYFVQVKVGSVIQNRRVLLVR